jgi:putative endopeptidase
MFRFLLALGTALLTAAPLHAQRADLGLDTAGMDRSVRPGDDFYRYANGNWLAHATIPADRSAYGAFNVADERATARLGELIRNAVATAAGATMDAPVSPTLRKIADYYIAYVDTTVIEGAGLAPLQPDLAVIEAIADRRALARYIGATLRADVDVINDAALSTDNLFGLWVDQDFDEPTKNSATFLQGGLALPDRSYYLDSAPAMTEIRAEYRAHVAEMLALAGFVDTDVMADSILALETRIAQVHWTREDTWDPVKGNNHWSRADFAAKAPGLDWYTFFDAAGLGDVTDFVAWQPSAVTGISALVASEPLASWKALLAYHAIEHRATVLPAAFDREHFAFFGQTLRGAEVRSPREERAAEATSAALGFAVGRLYVAQYFPASAKQEAERMVAGIIRAFDARIDALTWMAPATKTEAKAKLKTLRVSVGYPDGWPEYDGLEIVAGDAYGNAKRVERFEYRQNLEKLRRPVDRDEWSLTPQTVNAVNMPAMNAMNFPAAILEPPFFDPERPSVMNYAAIGAVIGHEISHSFDNLGAEFDAHGRLRNWWTPEDLAHFTASAEQLVRQYDTYRPFPDLAINGRLTLTENMADLAGVTAAYDAYRASAGGSNAPMMAGFSGDQQFFLSFAQMWRAKYRDAALRQRIMTDGHSPAPYRALVVRNLEPWYAAFDVARGETLYLAPEARVRIW